MQQETRNLHQQITAQSPRQRKELFVVRLPRELVQKVRNEAEVSKRSVSKQVEFFLEQVLVTKKP